MRIALLRLCLLVALAALPTLCHAGIIAHIPGPEREGVVQKIDETKRRLDMRFVEVDDPKVLAALVRATHRGVVVRLVVERVTPRLSQTAQGSGPQFQLRVLKQPIREKRVDLRSSWLTDRNRTFSARQKAFLRGDVPKGYLFDSETTGWFGTGRLSAGGWVDYSVWCSHRQYPDPPTGCELFLKAWNRAQPFDPRRPAPQPATRNLKSVVSVRAPWTPST